MREHKIVEFKFRTRITKLIPRDEVLACDRVHFT